MTPEVCTDAEALDAIAALLDGREWTADTAADIAVYVRETGRDIAEYDPCEEDDQ